MTHAKIKPSRILRNFLRKNMTDPNSGRSSYWIYDDYPLSEDKGFPLISITTISESSNPMGLYDDTQYGTVTLQVDVLSKNDEIHTITTTDESIGDVSSGVNSNRLTFEYVPYSVTNVKHDGTGFGTVTAKNTNSDFTSPASLTAGIIEWSKSTGDLNMSSADVTSYDGESITSTSVLKASNLFLSTYLGVEVYKLIKNNWRTDTTLNGLFNPRFLNQSPLPFEESLGCFRYVLEIQFNVINPHEGV